jgi:hypothetical protein
LLRQGIVYSGGKAWTDAHDGWLRRQRFDAAALQTALKSDYDAVLAVKARRDRLDAAIATLAAECEFTAMLRRLGCLRGIGTLTGFRSTSLNLAPCGRALPSTSRGGTRTGPSFSPVTCSIRAL